MFIHIITVWLPTCVRGVGAWVTGASRAQVRSVLFAGKDIENT